MNKTLTLVIPCHNEFRRLKPERYLAALERYDWLSFCFVNDGSTDRTDEVLAKLKASSPKIHVIGLAQNLGKAETVRTGIRYVSKNSAADIVGFWDADLAAPLYETERFMEKLETSPGCIAVIGSRSARHGSSIKRTLKRRFSAFIMRRLIRMFLHTPTYDTQCGAKIFTRELALEIFEKPFVSKWLFDVELLLRIGTERFKSSVCELPLRRWHDVPGSNLGFKDTFEIFYELYKIASAAR